MRGAINVEPDHDGAATSARIWLLMGGKTVQIAVRRTNMAAGQRRGVARDFCGVSQSGSGAVDEPVTRQITRQHYHSVLL
jgi:hypothetical protein